jgi:hypothetical protein
MVPSGNVNDIQMQFGKQTSHEFILDFKPPLSALQAFGLALSQFTS